MTISDSDPSQKYDLDPSQTRPNEVRASPHLAGLRACLYMTIMTISDSDLRTSPGSAE